MILDDWCTRNLPGGYKLKATDYADYRIVEAKRTRHLALLTVCDTRNKYHYLKAQWIGGKRKRNELGASWIVAIRP